MKLASLQNIFSDSLFQSSLLTSASLGKQLFCMLFPQLHFDFLLTIFGSFSSSFTSKKRFFGPLFTCITCTLYKNACLPKHILLIFITAAISNLLCPIVESTSAVCRIVSLVISQVAKRFNWKRRKNHAGKRRNVSNFVVASVWRFRFRKCKCKLV